VAFVDECLRRIPKGVSIRARFDSGFHDKALFEALERRGVTYLCGVRLNPKILGVIREIEDGCWFSCLDTDEGEVAEFGYRQAKSKLFRRYVVKRTAKNHGEQLDLESGAYNNGYSSPTTMQAPLPPWNPSTATRPWWSRACGS